MDFIQKICEQIDVEAILSSENFDFDSVVHQIEQKLESLMGGQSLHLEPSPS